MKTFPERSVWGSVCVPWKGSLVLVVLALVLLVSACQGTPAPSAPTSTSSATRAVSVSPEQTQVDVAPHHRVIQDDLFQASPRIQFEHLSIEHGLSQSSVHCIMQDSKGFMWFGTWDGLNRYDGYEFTVYKHDPEDPTSLGNGIVRAIYEDREGAIWVGTYGGGLDRFDRETETFVHYRHDPDDPQSLSHDMVLAVYGDRQGTLWVGTSGGGLDRFDRETETFVHHAPAPDDPQGLSHGVVLSIYEDREGTLWIGTDGGGLNRFDQAKGTFRRYQRDEDDPHSLSNNSVLSIYQDRQGVLWIGTAGGLDRFDRETDRFITYRYDPRDPYSLSGNTVWSVYEDRSGTLWVGTYGKGLNRFDRENERFIHYQYDALDPYSLSKNSVRAIYEDRSGVLWIGTNGGGLNKSDASTRRFVHYRHDPSNPNSLSDNDVFPIFQDDRGMLWIGTMEGGLDRFDRKTGTWTHYRHDPEDPDSLGHNVVHAIHQDREGMLWLGTLGGGLDRFDPEQQRFTHYRYLPYDPSSLGSHSVMALYEDREGVLWVGTSEGLDRFDRQTETFVHYRHRPDDPHSLSHNTVRALYEDHEGALWVGTDNGLNCLLPSDRLAGRFTRYRYDPDDPGSLSNNWVLAIHQDQRGVLWVATYGGGLNRFDAETETFAPYREKDGLANDSVYGILEDDLGCLWLSTNNGLSRFDLQTETFKNYDVQDGLQSNEFNGNSFFKSPSGEMFFGGINGFNGFFPQQITDNPYVPPVVLTSLTQGGQEVALDRSVETVEEVSFRWPNHFFEFEFSALSYVQPQENQYAYKLEGFDAEWNEVGRKRFGRYTNLPGGTYTLRMRASNNDGLWNWEGISLRVTIVPPFWKTLWFRIAVGVLVVGGAAGGYGLRVKRIEAKSRALEMQVAERTFEIERRRQELEALYRADKELYSHLRLDQVLQALVDIAVDLLEADKSTLVVWNEAQEMLVVRASRGFQPQTLAHMAFAKGDGTTVGQVAVTGNLLVVEDTRTDPRARDCVALVEAEGIRSLMHVPIKLDGELYGVFSADYARPHAFTEDEQRLYTALAQRAAIAIQNAQLYEKAQDLAVVEERNRLARDLHDAVTQTLFSASLIAEVLPALWENDQVEGRQLLQELRQLSRGALAEMRTLLLELRPAALVEARLADLLRQLAEAIAGREGIPVDVAIEGRCDLPPDVHVALYRIAQEALNNVVKHAQASQVEVHLRCDAAAGAGQDQRVELWVADDGRGFDPDRVPPDRLGLGIVRERAQAIGADLQIESRPGCGTCVRVAWDGSVRPVRVDREQVG